MILKIGNRAAITVANFHQASTAYATARNESGEGASTFPAGLIMADGKPLARVSYNAKVWGMEEWRPGALPLYDPYGGPTLPASLRGTDNPAAYAQGEAHRHEFPTTEA